MSLIILCLNLMTKFVMCASIAHAAEDLLLKLSCKRRRKNFFKDHHLKELCSASKIAWRAWQKANRPHVGQLWENIKKAVRKKINALRARKDRLHSEYMDEKFREKRNKRSNTGSSQGTRLIVNDQLVTDKEAVINTWATHFSDLSSSKAHESPFLVSLDSVISSYRSASFDHEDCVFDYDITTEEIQGAIKLPKKGKACGPDNVLPEHIIYGGDYLEPWLKKIFNEIITFKCIPLSLKESTIVPIYKAKGRDPLLTKNYRGISLSSVISKLHECIILLRIVPILEECGIPHHTQTAYQKGVSCSDATEAVQEVIKSYIKSIY